MRLLPIFLALPLLALQAHAQTAPPQSAYPAASAPSTGTPAPNATAPTTPAHHRMTWKQRFTQANLAHDGHLTMQEASGGDPSLARHFTEIDADKKGFVTEEDVTNWHKMQRAMRHSNRSQTNQGMQPRHAFEQGTITPQRVHTTNGQIVPTTQTNATLTGQQTTTQ
jgi:hypothetical protein